MIEVLKQALEALELCTNDGMIPMYLKANQTAITSLRQAIAQLALDAKAENAREFGLDYEPVCPECKAGVLYECVACSSNNYPPQRTEQEPVTRYCCHSCFKTSGGVMLDRMIVCPDCGNKRCPKASNHALKCTNSNDPNQAGSVFTHPPQRTWVGLTDDEIEKVWQNVETSDFQDCVQPFAQAIEAKLKQKNGFTEEKNK